MTNEPSTKIRYPIQESMDKLAKSKADMEEYEKQMIEKHPELEAILNG